VSSLGAVWEGTDDTLQRRGRKGVLGTRFSRGRKGGEVSRLQLHRLVDCIQDAGYVGV
jgi:hypothetical protein